MTLLSAGTMVPLPRDVKPVLAGFFGILMALIMTIACMNLASMLIARGARRQKELAIRLAVGASRFRIVRQTMSEGMLLSLAGGIAGLALAYFLSEMSSRFRPVTGLPVESNFAPDSHTLVFVGIQVLVCCAFSLAPALRATRVDVSPTLKQGAALQLPGYRMVSVRNLLMMAQVAGSLMLLMMTGFLVMGLSGAGAVQAKVDPRTLYVLSLDPVRDGYSSEEAQALFAKVRERLKTAGYARSVAWAAQAPFSIEDDEDEMTQLTAEDASGSSRVRLSVNEETVGAGYFAALNEPLLAGREFAETDERSLADASKALPIVLNRSAVSGFFGKADAIGKLIREDGQSYEVVGVVHDVKNGIGNSRPLIYLPLTKRNFAHPPAAGMTVLVRSDAGRDALGGIRREIALIDPNLHVFHLQTLSAYLQRSRSSERFAVGTYGGIGLFALTLAAVGLAGVTGYAVAQRHKEIGIRVALGASRAQVLRLVLQEGSALVGVGTIFGFLGALAAAKALSALTNIFVEVLRIGMGDPRLLVGAPLLLAAVAMLACYLPARRSAQIDPLSALREE